jgi:drug/metabolite transporter (DMT)-like permease
MPTTRILLLTACAMLAFAGNSLLCRIALKHTGIDAASFTSIRLISGALTLWLLTRQRRAANARTPTCDGTIAGTGAVGGNWLSAIALFIYAAGFSFAYLSLPAATGALLLFGAVQATMIGYGIWRGERLRGPQWLGLMLTFAGLTALLLPGIATPPLAGSLLMLAAGVAWGVYSLRGKGKGDPTLVTAGNFLRAAPMAVILSIILLHRASFDSAGGGYALASGALASGIGYAIWYTALPAMKATHAATVQLSVPVIAAIGGILFLGEPLSIRFVLASVAILGGIALVILERRRVP